MPRSPWRMHLKPLDAHGIAALAAFLLDGSPPPGLLPVLFERGAGNPFFVEETVRSLLDTGVLLHTSGKWELRPGWDDSEVAPTIEGVLAARIDAMPTRAARLLGVASVVGRRVRLGLLRAVASDGVMTWTPPSASSWRPASSTKAPIRWRRPSSSTTR